jgi:hypothetical protein
VVAGTLAFGFVGAFGATPNQRLPAARPDCPLGAHALVEHFIGADCAACWDADAPPAGGAPTPGSEPVAPGAWSLDWLVPARNGAAAPLAPAAIAESAQRLERLGPYLAARLEVAPAGFDTSTPLAPPTRGRRMWVHSSLPFQGYFGVQMHVRGRWPEGATGWVGLVDPVPPGTEGSPIARHVVRVLTGPVPLPASPASRDGVDPLFALRWPEMANPGALMAVAWIEGRDGRVLQLASDRCPDPK